jgi:hypothetical protein
MGDRLLNAFVLDYRTAGQSVGWPKRQGSKQRPSVAVSVHRIDHMVPNRQSEVADRPSNC